jgi:hypothetical protein
MCECRRPEVGCSGRPRGNGRNKALQQHKAIDWFQSTRCRSLGDGFGRTMGLEPIHLVAD